jgi:hypothetical protein
VIEYVCRVVSVVLWFDNSGEIVQSVMDEYKASETPDYINWGEDSKEAVVPGLTC